MALLVGRIARLAAQRIASNPRARDLVAKAAKGLADEAKVVAKEEDKARAAGRSVRRLVDRFRRPDDERTDSEPDEVTNDPS